MERRSVSSNVVYAALVATLAIGFVAALYIHARFAQYSPRVVAHLPETVQVAVWMNVEQTVGYDAFEAELLPLLELGRTEKEPRVKLIERKTSLELPVDTHEIAFAMPTSDSWVLLLGGMYRKDRVVVGVSRMFADLGVKSTVKGEVCVLEPSGATFAAGDDGVLVFASSEELARASQHRNASGGAYKSLLNKPGSTLNVMAYQGAPEVAGRALDPAGVVRLWISVQPGETFPTLMEAVLQPGRNMELPGPQQSAFVPAAAWTKVDSPEGIVAGSGELQTAQFREIVATWSRLMQSQLGPAVAP